DVIKARNEMLKHPKIKKILKELEHWPGPAIKRHNDASHLIHKLIFLVDLGFNKKDKVIREIAVKVLKHQSLEGPFQIKVNIPKAFGGSGRDELSWIACDAVDVVYALIKFGYKDHPKVKKAFDFLLKLQRDNGWPCSCDTKLGGKFRGPGRKDDPCPYFNFYMVKVLSKLPKYHKSKEAQIGIDTIFELWKDRKRRKPYLFGMGTDFSKLKAPFVWYDILHVLDALTKFKHLKGNKYLKEMMNILEAKTKDRQMLKAESVYRSWSDWDFGQKKDPSEWITLLVYRILKRYKEL
ncbi:hypothetical protein KJ918_03785, partial [Patescibacteria group bacterium]|nr:hypothetical protein [Patescibacteria group bacterium]